MKSQKVAKAMKSRSTKRREREAEGGASGALVGAIVGATAGPPGAVAGAIVGGIAGVLVGAVIDQESSAREQRTRELDDAIGVNGGSMGAPNLEHPPSTRGTYSASSSGVSPSEKTPAEGPMQAP
jgi:phage tail tape-measure protein